MSRFEIKDCTLLTRMSGLAPACNLRELRDRMALCSLNVIYHHFCETLLVPSFNYPDYRNDLAVWARHHLRDEVLGERLGIIDPYGFASLEELRTVIIDILDERISERDMVPWAPPGHDFHFMEATTVVFDTGRSIEHPEKLPAAIPDMTGSSIFFHFFEARRRPPLGLDDFSAWLQSFEGDWSRYSKALADIDFPFYTLAETKNVLLEALSLRERRR